MLCSTISRTTPAILFALLLQTPSPGQGGFVNFETPQTKPICVAEVSDGKSSRRVVLICNTPDNSVEIYGAEPPHASIQRVPVGMGPCTVRWNADNESFYVCNFDGDSVTKVRLEASPGSPLEITASVERTVVVGDEPSDIAFSSSGTDMLALVTLNSRGAFAVLNADDLSFRAGYPTAAAYPDPRRPESRFVCGDSDLMSAIANISPSNPFYSQIEYTGVKAARQVAWVDGRLFVLNFMGESPNPSSQLAYQYDLDPAEAFAEAAATSSQLAYQYDLDLWFDNDFDPDAAAMQSNPDWLGEAIGGLGSTNHAFALNEDRSLMVVVGTKAVNHAVLGEPPHRDLPFGFVQSRMWVVDIPDAGALNARPTVRPVFDGVFPPGGPAPLPSRNLNARWQPGASPGPGGGFVPVARESALSQPTDVALIESGGTIDRIVIAAYHSDKVALLRPDVTVNGAYQQEIVHLDPVLALDGNGPYTVAGPRGLAYSAQENLIYVSCRLDNSLRVIDPVDLTQQSIPLLNDPTPRVIRGGRKMLYDADFSSASGFVSCASCHVDARTDGLTWNLGSGESGSEPDTIEPEDVETRHVTPQVFPPDKGPLVTQTLQGLVNYLVDGDDTNSVPARPAKAQDLLTNAPYHWRGDREDFQAFANAFKVLIGLGDELDFRAATEDEMNAFTAFVNTIRHPSNPEQPLDRRVTGEFTPPKSTGTALSQEFFFEGRYSANHLPQEDFLSCITCHSGVEGSGNTLTVPDEVPGTHFSGVKPVPTHPFESAALRNLTPREAVRNGNTYVSNSGLLHDGGTNTEESSLIETQGLPRFDALSIDAFIASRTIPPAELTIDYTRQFDTGTAPLAGWAYTLAGNGAAEDDLWFDRFEEQAREGNIGLAVRVHLNSSHVGFVYDVTRLPSDSPYTNPDYDVPFVSRGYFNTAASDGFNYVVVLQATPLGSARRVASHDGTPRVIFGLPPHGIELEPMVPMTYYVNVPGMNRDVRVADPGGQDDIGAIGDRMFWALRSLQLSLLNNSSPEVPDGFGLGTGILDLHQEPPRRLRVSGAYIRPGAQLILGIPAPSDPGDGQPFVLDHEIVFDLHPVLTNNGLIWETEQELDPIVQLQLLHGGPYAPGVQQVVNREGGTQTTDPDPVPDSSAASWNGGFGFEIRVRNEDGTESEEGVFATLTLQDDRSWPLP